MTTTEQTPTRHDATSHCAKILKLLKAKGRVTNFELRKIAWRYPARILDLKHEGHLIRSVHDKGARWFYIYEGGRVMSRQVKFRAIEVATGQHLLWNSYFDIDNDGVVFRVAFDEGREVISVQYTGLKDKNGAEIYEGDTIKYRPLENATGQKIFVVEWRESRNYTGFNITRGHYGQRLTHMEVIENVKAGDA